MKYLLLLASLALGGQSKLSHRDFTGRLLLDAKIAKGDTVVGSCFSQEIPNTVVFPAKMTGVVFVSCNLDDVYLDTTLNKIIGGSHRMYKHNDADSTEWLVDSKGNFTEPMNPKVIGVEK